MTRQCVLLDLPRSTFYHVPKPVSEEELELMALINRCHLKYPFYGSRRIRDWLEDQGRRVNRKKVQRLTRTMDLVALYPKHNLSLANQAHKVYPYLLRGLVIDRPNQAWATDITYIPMARGFVYLVAVMIWYSPKVLSWRVSTRHPLLCRCPGGSYRALWCAGDIQHRPGQQNLKIKILLGTSRNAVMTQIWIAICIYLLLTYLKFVSQIRQSMQQILRLLQVNLFARRSLLELRSCGSPEPFAPQLQTTFKFS